MVKTARKQFNVLVNHTLKHSGINEMTENFRYVMIFMCVLYKDAHTIVTDKFELRFKRE